MKILNTFSRLIIGIAFIFSGIVKAIDPLGSAYKFEDYFHAFHLDFLHFSVLPLAIFLCTVEFISGFSVITGYRIRSGIIVVMILMLIFTPLTFILALTNPVSDCGCFGDAIHLTNWQTFGKNLFLFIFAVILFRGRNNIIQQHNSLKEWLVISGMDTVLIIFSLLNLRFLPVMDFLPYKLGIHIPEKMIMPEGKPVDEYKTTFIYEKDGVQQEFTLDNFPATDSSWTFIDQKSVLVKKGYEPPIHDFSVISSNNEDLTDIILADRGYSVLMISKKLGEAKTKYLNRGYELGYHCMANGISFYILSASGSDELRNFDNGLRFCSADEITLKTIIRSNPGYLLLREGTIIAKWSWATLPDNDWFTGNIEGKQIELLNTRLFVLKAITITLSLTLVILLISILLKIKVNKK